MSSYNNGAAEKAVAHDRTEQEPERELPTKTSSEAAPVVVSTVAATDAANKTTDFDEVPDGGLVAWLQVAGSFALFFNSW